jgi:restriction system protein
MMTLDQELDKIVENLPEINPHKSYWLVRTESGEFYDDFVKNKYIAIEPGALNLDAFRKIERATAGNDEQLIRQIKQFIKERTVGTNDPDANEKRSISLKANQIVKFYSLNKGDIILIPSKNSNYVSIGEIIELGISNFSESEILEIECPYELRRRVKWLKEIPRYKLDVNLYMVFASHQTITDLYKYANVIERSVNDFYILFDSAHLILNVNTETGISANSLFRFGSMLMDMLDEFAEYAEVDVSSEYLELQINLNSPGTLDLKAKIKKTTLILGVLTFLGGGGYEDKAGRKFKTDGVPGIIRAVSDYLNQRQNREMKDKLFAKYSDSLNVKSPDDLNKLMKQFSENKDLPK